jgi:vacuolar-type H+-ATPase subunit D/Vma8
MRRTAAIILVLTCGGLNAACDSLYYKAMKKVGYEKRDILLKRIREARKSQVEAQEDVKSALERFQAVVDTGHGGALQDKYEELSKALERAERRATAVHDRVQQVREVSKDLFNEWEDELKKYSDRGLRAESDRELRQARTQAGTVIGAMTRAEKRLEPVLKPMRDRVLFLKHNLNAKVLGGLAGELTTIQSDVDALLVDLQASIAEADEFIKTMEAAQASAKAP